MYVHVFWLQVSVYSVPEKKEQTSFALATASKLLQFYSTFLEIDYPLKKLGKQSRNTYPIASLLLLLCPLCTRFWSICSLSDLVAIPDFLAGAMENWGLITFRETTLLLGNNSSSLEKRVVASVIAHEMAHQVDICVYCLTPLWQEQHFWLCLVLWPISVFQWFGNLVTMSWWNDLWLNEGFATYMEYMSLQEILPDLDTVRLTVHQRISTFFMADKCV